MFHTVVYACSNSWRFTIWPLKPKWKFLVSRIVEITSEKNRGEEFKRTIMNECNIHSYPLTVFSVLIVWLCFRSISAVTSVVFSLLWKLSLALFARLFPRQFCYVFVTFFPIIWVVNHSARGCPAVFVYGYVIFSSKVIHEDFTQSTLGRR